ncbi:MAG: succinylglutamate desuccinylase/aspartoacylase family protein [Candidatus Nanohaloarchaea archaeon]|nr:succinylglutamate desuccinylase/aspartoacylase family protein [Candidatus Nanohaloarchaea archaeon]
MQQETLATFEMMDGDYHLDAYRIGAGDPVCVITAGIHGDETPSIQVAEALIERLSSHDVAGTAVVIPRSNVFACSDNTRETPWPRYEEYESQERNLNRCFDAAFRDIVGESVQLNLTERMAVSILEEVREADYLIDMHTGTWPGKKVPQVRMKEHERYDRDVIETMEGMVAHSGLETVFRTSVDEIGSGVLAAVAPRLGVPAVTLEAGGPKHFSEEDFETYIEAVENLLGYMGVLESGAERVDASRYHGLVPVYTSTAGSLDRRTAIGQPVDEGEIIAVIRNSQGEEAEEVRSPVGGMVEMMNQRRAVNQGIRIAKIAYRD